MKTPSNTFDRTCGVIAIAMILIALMLTSCSQSGRRVAENKSSLPLQAITRAKILENGIVTYVSLSDFERTIYRHMDTVWMDVDTHTISDTAEYGMAAVLYWTPALPKEMAKNILNEDE